MTDSLLQGIHHIAIRARDYDASLAFYTEGLGMTATMTWGEGDGRAAMLDCGGGCVELFAGGSGDKPEGVWLHLAFNCDDPDTAFTRALAAGATEMKAPFDFVIPSNPPLPVRLAFVFGPDGEVLEFFKTR